MSNLFRKNKAISSFLGLIFYVVSPVVAQTGDWQMQEGGRIRISFDAQPRFVSEGEAHGLIEVELKPGWKTYWKDPGSSGMAPQLDLFASAGDFDEIKLNSELLFPEPSIFAEKAGTGVTFGYKNAVQLPFRLTMLAETRAITGSLWIGLCDDVCMPTQVQFAFDVKGEADFLTKGRIEAAFAALPQL